jgi:hypothetical protein
MGIYHQYLMNQTFNGILSQFMFSSQIVKILKVSIVGAWYLNPVFVFSLLLFIKLPTVVLLYLEKNTVALQYVQGYIKSQIV